MNTAEIISFLNSLAARGMAVTISPSRMLQVRPGSLLTGEDRARLRVGAAAILAQLDATVATADIIAIRGSEPWNGGVARKLMDEADELVAQLGVDGRHSDIQLAAAMVCSASATRDMGTLRLACREFEVAVCKLARRLQPRRDHHAVC